MSERPTLDSLGSELAACDEFRLFRYNGSVVLAERRERPLTLNPGLDQVKRLTGTPSVFTTGFGEFGVNGFMEAVAATYTPAYDYSSRSQRDPDWTPGVERSALRVNVAGVEARTFVEKSYAGDPLLFNPEDPFIIMLTELLAASRDSSLPALQGAIMDRVRALGIQKPERARSGGAH